MRVPTQPKIYHIVHVDRLPSIVADGYLWCDAKMRQRSDDTGTAIGINDIKQRRSKNTLTNYPDLHLGECVPFYFCPRSVMLYVIHKDNHPKLPYHGGQEPILHLEADLHETVDWADRTERRWAFSKSHAAASYSEHFSDLARLDKLDWDVLDAEYWPDRRDDKQAEFLVEYSFSWRLVRRIGVLSRTTRDEASRALGAVAHRPPVEIKPDWYY